MQDRSPTFGPVFYVLSVGVRVLETLLGPSRRRRRPRRCNGSQEVGDQLAGQHGLAGLDRVGLSLTTAGCAPSNGTWGPGWASASGLGPGRSSNGRIVLANFERNHFCGLIFCLNLPPFHQRNRRLFAVLVFPLVFLHRRCLATTYLTFTWYGCV